LTPPDPRLKGASYPGGFNPRTYQAKTRFQNVLSKMQLAPLQFGIDPDNAFGGAVQVESS
jgi:hypothetical protein